MKLGMFSFRKCSLTMYLCVAVDAHVALQEHIVRYRVGHHHHLLNAPWTPCALSLCGQSLQAGDRLPPQAAGTAIAEGQTTVATIWILLVTIEPQFSSALIFLTARTASQCAILVEDTVVLTLADG